MNSNSDVEFHAPHRALAIGMWLFLAALTMLFLSSMALYAMMRLGIYGRSLNKPIHLPSATWASTAALLAGSFTIHRAVANVRRERQKKFLQYLYLTSALAVLFLIIQFPCMGEILSAHLAYAAKLAAAQTPGIVRPLPLYGLVFFLILLHALHVVGGVVAMAVVTVHAKERRYDHENYLGVRNAALYWHFLDAVWLTMFTMFLVLG